MRTEYQPPADVLALIHAFLAKNPDFFGKDKGRAARPTAVPAPAPAAIPPSAPQTQRHEAASPMATYAPAPAATPAEMRDEWLAIALDALDYAIDVDSDAYATPLNKARMVNKLLNLVAFHASQQGGETLNAIEIGILIRPYAELLAGQLPRTKDNREDCEYQRTKERIKKDKERNPGGNGPVH